MFDREVYYLGAILLGSKIMGIEYKFEDETF